MAEHTSERSSTGLAFIVGGLVVAVVVIAYLVLGGDIFGSRDVDIDVNVPATQAPLEPAAPAQPANPPATTN